MAKHSELTPTDGIHKPYSFEYADTNARDTATGFVAGDVGKLCYISDTGEVFRLKAVSPSVVWERIVQDADLAAHTTSISNPHGVTALQATCTATPANYSAASNNVQSHLEGVDTALGGLSGGSPGGGVNSIQYHDGAGNFSGSDARATSAGAVWFPEITAPGTPDTGYGTVYAKSDSKLYFKDDSGTETELTGGGGGGGSPGGSSGQIQYNDGASGFAGSAAKVSAAGAVDLPEIAAPSTPSSGFATVFAKADGTVNVKTDGGEEHRISPKQVAGVLVSPNQDGAEMMRVAGRSAASGAGPSFNGGTGTGANQYCFLMIVTPYAVQGPGANQSSFTTTRGFFTMSGGTGGISGIYGGVTRTSATSWTQYRTTGSGGSGTNYADTLAIGEAGPSIVGQSQLTYGVSASNNLTMIGPGIHARTNKGTMHENQMAQVDIGLGLGEAIIHSCGSVDCSSGNPFTSPVHFKLCQRIWLKEGEFRDIASAEVGNLGAVTFYRRWIPSGITVSSGTTVNGWAEAGGNTGSDMTVEGGATPVKLTIDWGAR